MPPKIEDLRGQGICWNCGSETFNLAIFADQSVWGWCAGCGQIWAAEDRGAIKHDRGAETVAEDWDEPCLMVPQKAGS